MGPIISMLITIELMRFYLRTGYGDSDGFYGGASMGEAATAAHSRVCAKATEPVLQYG